MKKVLLLFLLAVYVVVSLFAEVYKSTSEIRAYKETGSSSSPQQQDVTIELLDPTETPFADGYNIAIPEENRNSVYTAFYWRLSGNRYRQVSLKFSFSPMYLGVLNDYSSANIDEKTSVIPYSVRLSHISTVVSGTAYSGSSTSQNVAVRTSKISTYDTDTALNSGTTYNNSYTVYVNYGEKVTIGSSQTISTSTVQGVSISYDFNSYSYAWYKRYSNSYREYTSLQTCNNWVRVGKADITLKIDEDGNWTDVDTDVLISGGTYKAFVTVTVEVN